MSSTYVVVKIGDVYSVALQDHNRGFDTEERAQVDADFLNNEVFTFISPLGKGSSKLGTKDKGTIADDRKESNDKVKRRFKLTTKEPK